MEKSHVFGDRGVRRHRSFSKWAHRVQERRHWGGWISGFWLKNTGKPCSCWMCGNPRRTEGPTLQEVVADIGDRENWSRGRKRRKGFRKARLQCVRCGYLLGFEEIPFRGMISRANRRKLCKGCREREGK